MNVPITVGIVEDHNLLREAFASMLRTMGFVLKFAAANGRECLEKLKHANCRPDVLIVDVQMPVMDGFETTCRVHEQFPDIRILGHSLYNDKIMLKKLEDCGASGHLVKGRDMDRIQETVISLAEKQNTTTEHPCNQDGLINTPLRA